MADFKNQVKKMWIRGMEKVGNTASNIASNTKYKVDEMNLQNRRRDLFSSIGPQAYILWQKGEQFPDVISRMLEEIQKLDEQLNDMRAERYTGKEKTQESLEDHSDPEQDDETVPDQKEGSEKSKPENGPAVETVSGTAIHQTIDSLFNNEKTVNQLADKVNESLDKLDENRKKYSETENGDQKGV